MIIRPKNWREFQHYKDRSPPWIRLHRGLLDDYDFQCLPVASKALAPMLWLLASCSDDLIEGRFDASPQKMAFRLRMSEQDFLGALNPLIQNGFFIVAEDASGVLASRLRDAVPEAEAEAEAEAEKKKKATRTKVRTPPDKPDDVSDQVWQDWLALRKAKRAPVSDTVLAEARREAAKAGIPLQRFFEIWCSRGSQGLEAGWLKPSEIARDSFAPTSKTARGIAALEAMKSGNRAQDSMQPGGDEDGR